MKVKNYKTTAGAIAALAIVLLDNFGVTIPGVTPHQMDLGAVLALIVSAFFAKDKDVTGAGDDARRVK